MKIYCADTGMSYHEYEADNDFEAVERYPEAQIWRKDGTEMNEKAFEGFEIQS